MTVVRSPVRSVVRSPVMGVTGYASSTPTLTALAQILALDPTALWWPENGSGWQGRTGGTLSAVGSPVGILPDLSELGGATLDEWLEAPTTPELNDGLDVLANWTAFAGNTVIQDGDAIKITYVNNAQGAYSFFRATAGLNTNLTVGKSYRVTGQAKVNSGSANVLVNTASVWSSSAITSTTYVDFTIYFLCDSTTLNYISAGNMGAGEEIWIRNISVRELPGIHAIAASDAERPLLADDPTRLTWDKVDDRLITTMPATTGKMVLATPEGTAVYGVNISAGSYDVGGRGGDYFPGTSLVGQTVGDFTDEEAASVAAIFRAAGGGDDYGGVTDFSNFWRGWSELTSFPVIDTSSGTNFLAAWLGCNKLTSFPLIDTSSGTNFSSAWTSCTSLTAFPLLDTSSGTNFSFAWFDCTSLTSFPALDTSSGTSFYLAWYNCASLTTFPLLDVSSGTSFKEAWRNCSSLTTFPAGMFDTVTATNFTSAFTNTALSQTSIENILVSINTAGTSGGTFAQSGGSAPSATGEAAIDALRGRGWTVTVTGGY